MKKLLFVLLLSVSFFSCMQEEANEDVVNAPPKDGAVAVNIATTPLGDQQVLSITYDVYKNGVVTLTRTVNDTLPGLGTMKAETEEDEDGNTNSVTVPKQYEVYVTVK